MLSGTVDVTVVHLSARERLDIITGGAVDRRVRVLELGEVGRVVVLRGGHRLAQRASVQVEDLEGEPIVRAHTSARAEHGRAEHGGVDQGGVDQGGVDQGGVDQGGVDQGGVDQGGVDQGGVDQGETGPVHRAWRLDPRPVGVGPHLVGPAVGAVQELLAVVAAGQGIAVAPADLLHVYGGEDDLVFVPLRGVEPVQLCAVVRDLRATE